MVVAVVRAWHDDGPDAGRDEPGQFPGDALDRPARLDVGVEQVARDEDEVHLLRDREIDGGPEGGELTLALRRRLVTEVVVARAEVDVRGVDDP